MDDIIEESGFAQYFMQRGRVEGRVEGRRQMAQIVLEGRFGPVPADLLAALDTADIAILEEIVAHVSTDSLELVRQRLGLG